MNKLSVLVHLEKYFFFLGFDFECTFSPPYLHFIGINSL